MINAFRAGGHSFSFVGSAPASAAEPPSRFLRSPSPEDMEFALQAKVENESELFRQPGVLGVGVGAAEEDPFEAVIVVYFDRSAVSNVPPRIDGFRTRVIVTDPIVAQ